MRVGIGTDVHAYDPAQPCHVAGLHWPGVPGLAGHSDGDVIAHALIDAILGAAGMGDISSLFPPGEPEWKGASSLDLLARAYAHVR